MKRTRKHKTVDPAPKIAKIEEEDLSIFRNLSLEFPSRPMMDIKDLRVEIARSGSKYRAIVKENNGYDLDFFLSFTMMEAKPQNFHCNCSCVEILQYCSHQELVIMYLHGIIDTKNMDSLQAYADWAVKLETSIDVNVFLRDKTTWMKNRFTTTLYQYYRIPFEIVSALRSIWLLEDFDLAFTQLNECMSFCFSSPLLFGSEESQKRIRNNEKTPLSHTIASTLLECWVMFMGDLSCPLEIRSHHVDVMNREFSKIERKETFIRDHPLANVWQILGKSNFQEDWLIKLLKNNEIPNIDEEISTLIYKCLVLKRNNVDVTHLLHFILSKRIQEKSAVKYCALFHKISLFSPSYAALLFIMGPPIAYIDLELTRLYKERFKYTHTFGIRSLQELSMDVCVNSVLEYDDHYILEFLDYLPDTLLHGFAYKYTLQRFWKTFDMEQEYLYRNRLSLDELAFLLYFGNPVSYRDLKQVIGQGPHAVHEMVESLLVTDGGISPDQIQIIGLYLGDAGYHEEYFRLLVGITHIPIKYHKEFSFKYPELDCTIAFQEIMSKIEPTTRLTILKRHYEKKRNEGKLPIGLLFLLAVYRENCLDHIFDDFLTELFPYCFSFWQSSSFVHSLDDIVYSQLLELPIFYFSFQERISKSDPEEILIKIGDLCKCNLDILFELSSVARERDMRGALQHFVSLAIDAPISVKNKKTDLLKYETLLSKEDRERLVLGIFKNGYKIEHFEKLYELNPNAKFFDGLSTERLLCIKFLPHLIKLRRNDIILQNLRESELYTNFSTLVIESFNNGMKLDRFLEIYGEFIEIQVKKALKGQDTIPSMLIKGNSLHDIIYELLNVGSGNHVNKPQQVGLEMLKKLTLKFVGRFLRKKLKKKYFDVSFIPWLVYIHGFFEKNKSVELFRLLVADCREKLIDNAEIVAKIENKFN